MDWFFFERYSLITATVCAYKLNNARKRKKHCLYTYNFETCPTTHFYFSKNFIFLKIMIRCMLN